MDKVVNRDVENMKQENVENEWDWELLLEGEDILSEEQASLSPHNRRHHRGPIKRGVSMKSADFRIFRSDAEKEQILREYIRSGENPAGFERKTGCSKSNIQYWMKNYPKIVKDEQQKVAEGKRQKIAREAAVAATRRVKKDLGKDNPVVLLKRMETAKTPTKSEDKPKAFTP